MSRFSVSQFIACFVATLVTVNAMAHEPNRECQCVKPRVDVIGPIGANLRPSYRRVYNRPTYLQGRLAYLIAPTSQEAIAWHKADHKGAYKNELGRIEPRYFYKKPWEALRQGPRLSNVEMQETTLQPLPEVDAAEMLPQPEEPQPEELPEPEELPAPKEQKEDENSINDMDTGLDADKDEMSLEDGDNDAKIDSPSDVEDLEDLAELLPAPTVIDQDVPSLKTERSLENAIKSALDQPVGSGLKLDDR